MNQYCRYCCNAVICDVVGFVCVAKAPCGNNGAGKIYSEEKAKRINHCKSFQFNSNDLLTCDEYGNFKQYKPREPYKPRTIQAKEAGQISFNESEV
mgnify:CR=1 FL=1